MSREVFTHIVKSDELLDGLRLRSIGKIQFVSVAYIHKNNRGDYVFCVIIGVADNHEPTILGYTQSIIVKMHLNSRIRLSDDEEYVNTLITDAGILVFTVKGLNQK